MQRTTACSLSYFQPISRLRDLPKQVFGISFGEKRDCASPKRSKRPPLQEKVRSCEFFASQDSHNRTFSAAAALFPKRTGQPRPRRSEETFPEPAPCEAPRRHACGCVPRIRPADIPYGRILRTRPPKTRGKMGAMMFPYLLAQGQMTREVLGLQGRRPLPGASGNPAQQLSALVDVVKLGARENGKVEAVDAQGIALAGIMGSLLRRAMRIVPVVFQHNSLSGPKPIAHHAAQSRGRPRAVGQCDRFVQKRRSQAQPSLGKQGERNDGYLCLHERPRLGKHLLRRRSGRLHARQTLCTGGKSRKAPR